MHTGTLPATSVRSAFPGGDGVPDLERALRHLTVEDHGWDLRKPLPASRELGSWYRISNVSVCRVLRRLELEGVVWQRENGRYYPYGSRRLLERRRTYSCLLRFPATWTSVQQSILAGVAQACSEEPSSLMFVHDGAEGGASGVKAAGTTDEVAKQREILRGFFRDGDHRGEGMLLDQYWLDDALAAFPHRLKNAVILGRGTDVPEVSSVSMDLAAAALLGLAHLFARGFTHVRVLAPERPCGVARQFASSVRNAMSKLGCPNSNEALLSLDELADKKGQGARAVGNGRKVALFCWDEVTAIRAFEHLERAEMPGGGILVGNGSAAVADLNLSSLAIDHVEMGRRAGGLLRSGEHRTILLPPQLIIRGST